VTPKVALVAGPVASWPSTVRVVTPFRMSGRLETCVLEVMLV
jgi:hypothetical protein